MKKSEDINPFEASPLVEAKDFLSGDSERINELKSEISVLKNLAREAYKQGHFLHKYYPDIDLLELGEGWAHSKIRKMIQNSREIAILQKTDEPSRQQYRDGRENNVTILSNVIDNLDKATQGMNALRETNEVLRDIIRKREETNEQSTS